MNAKYTTDKRLATVLVLVTILAAVGWGAAAPSDKTTLGMPSVRMVSAIDRIPTILTEYSGTVDRVEFFFNEELIGVSYAAPYSMVLMPEYMNRSGYDAFEGNNEIAVRMIGNGATVESAIEWPFQLNGDNAPIRVNFEEPEEIVYYTRGETMEEHWIPVQVEAYRFELNPPIGDGPLGRRGRRGEERTDIANVSFTIAGREVDPDTLRRTGEHSWLAYGNLVGLPLGEHTIRARATDHAGNWRSATRRIRIERDEPAFGIDREVVRLDNTFRVTLRLTNRGTRGARLETLCDTLDGLQPFGTNSIMSVRWEAGSHYGRVVIRDNRWFAPGESRTYIYHAVPVLIPRFSNYRFGGRSYCTFQLDGTEHRHELPYVTTRVYDFEGGPLVAASDAVSSAIAGSDYLALTSPHRLFALHNYYEVNSLLDKVAELAALRQGVVGYYHPTHSRNVGYLAGNPCFLARVKDYTVPNFIALNQRDRRIHCHDEYGPSELGPSDSAYYLDWRDGDAIVPCNWFSRASDMTSRSGLLWVQGHNHPDSWGKMVLLSYNLAEGCLTTQTLYESTSYQCVWKVIAGDFMVDVTGTDDDGEEIVLLDSHSGNATLLSPIWSNTSHVAYGHGQPAVAGALTGHAYETLVIGDVDAGTLRFYRFAMGAGFHLEAEHRWDLQFGDTLLAADVDGNGREDLIVVEKERQRLRILRYEPAGLTEIGTIRTRIGPRDVVMAGPYHRNGTDVFAIARGTDGGGDDAMTLSVFPFEGTESIGNAHAIDRLLNIGGEWCEKLHPDWYRWGYLLIVGETEIIPAFRASWDLYDGRAVDYTPRPVATTDRNYSKTQSTEMDRPDISVGRIIGDFPINLQQVVEASLETIRHPEHFQYDRAFCVSGYRSGPGGGSDYIDCDHDRRQVRRILDDFGFSITEDDTSYSFLFGEFFEHCNAHPLIYLTAHGSQSSWDVIHRDDVERWFRPAHPNFVAANSCLTGQYQGRTCLAEYFLRNGAAAYWGATAISYVPGGTLNQEFLSRIDNSCTLGSALKCGKRALGNKGTGNTRRARRYNNAVFHFFGDPKLSYGVRSTTHFAVRTAASDSREFVGPKPNLEIFIPSVEWREDDGKDRADIPGGAHLLEPNLPMTPTYGVSVTYPKGLVVQEVRLVKRENATTIYGVDLPLFSDARTSDAQPLSNDAWPLDEFTWTVSQEPDGSSVVHIETHPLVYDAAKRTANVYSRFEFEIAHAESPVGVERVTSRKTRHSAGETVCAGIWLFLENTTAQFATLSGRVRSEEGDFEKALPSRTLMNARGLVYCALEWDSTGATPGEYAIEFEIADEKGVVLARGATSMELEGESFVEVTDVTVEAENPGVGGKAEMHVAFSNAGHSVFSGQLMVLVQDSAGVTLATYTHSISNLPAGASSAWVGHWINADLPRGNYRVTAYLLGSDLAAEPAVHAQAPLPLDLDGPNALGVKDGRVTLRWPRLPGYEYTVHSTTDLTKQPAAPMPGSLSDDGSHAVFETAATDKALYLYVSETPSIDD